ncbi:MAG: hypothetical protein ACJ8BW_07720 [Ktedonobacteraceae bacterium]
MAEARGEMAEAAFIVPLLPVPQTGWRLLCHYYDGDRAARVQIGKSMNHTRKQLSNLQA